MGPDHVGMLEVQENARRVVLEWMNVDDALIKEPIYTNKEQSRNDHHLERIKMITKKLLAHRGAFGNMLKTISTTHGVKGQLLRTVGAATLWIILHEYSSLFLRPRKQRPGDAQAWLDLLLAFEAIVKHFKVWSYKTYPTLTEVEELQALRVIWVAVFLAGSGAKAETSDWEPLFAFSLLYPLVDNTLDTESDPVERNKLASYIRSRSSSVGGITTTVDHSEFSIYGELIDKILKRATYDDASSQLLRQLLDHLLDCEMERQPTEILFHTSLKGGLTTTIIQVLLRNPLSQADSLNLMRLGFTLQIVDDLQDSQHDTATRTPTVPAFYYHESPALRRQYTKAINFIRHQLFATPLIPHKLGFRDGLKTVLGESLVSLCMEAAASSAALKAEDRILITAHSPVSVDFMRKHPIEATLHHMMTALMK